MAPRRPPREVKAEWEFQLRQATQNNWAPKCFNDPIPFVEVRQTKEQAEALCDGCPLKDLHHELGYAAKLDHQVAGGDYWIKGKPIASKIPAPVGQI